MPQHRAGRLKQVNKKHKIPGGTKPSNEHAIAGRVARKTAKQATAHTLGKQEKLNRHKQLMQEKRLQTIRTKRQATSTSTTHIAVFPLSYDTRFSTFASFLLSNNSDFTFKQTEELTTFTNVCTLYSKSQKTNINFFTPGLSEYAFDPLAIAEAVSSCHTVLLLLDCSSEDMVHPLIDNVGSEIIQLLASYGFPGISVAFLSNPSQKFNFRHPPKVWKSEIEKTLQQLSIFSAELKYYDLKDGNLSRYLIDQSKVLKWRQQRSYLLSQKLRILDSSSEDEDKEEEETESTTCKIAIQGVISGAPLLVHSLVHLAGIGTARIVKVTKVNQKPHHHHHNHNRRVAATTTSEGMMTTEEEEEMNLELEESIEADPKKQDELILEAEYDHLQGEQTWPSDQEMIPHDNNDGNPIDDDHDSLGDNNEEEEEEDEGMEFFNREQLPGSRKPDRLTQAMEEDHHPDEEEEEEEDRGDIVDTPIDMPARTRFARYRFLQSFRASVWNPKQNLPPQYAQIFEFEDMKGMQRRLGHFTEELLRKQFEPYLQIYQSSSTNSLRSRTTSAEGINEDNNNDDEMDTGSVQSTASHSLTKSKTTKQLHTELPLLLDGVEEDYVRSDQYVEIELDQVPRQALQAQWERNHYLSLYSLHRHEYKLSVLHFTIKRVPGNQTVVKSKDRLLFFNGFRSFWTKPIFSESNLNCDKHKFYRYLPMEGFSVASCIGPVTMTTTCPLLIFKQSEIDGSLQLLATGNALSIDPDRIMLKKIILLGNPIRVKKRSGVIKHMFYDPLDVKYFKPVELITKHGLRGHITGSVGTHGLFKASFSGMITQNDKAMLVLYKRVFPKIPEEGIVVK